MTGKTTLNAKNLESLGAQKLAELLIEISTGSAAAKRRLRLELAGSRGSSEVAHEVRKRLASVARSTTFINWRRVKAVRADLETQRRTIVDVVAADDPREAYELIWQLLAMATSIMGRTSETGATLIEVFHQANEDAASIARMAATDPARLAETVFKAIQTNEVGQYDPLIGAMAPVLGAIGLRRLNDMLVMWRDEVDDGSAIVGDEIATGRSKPPSRETGAADRIRGEVARVALRKIADAQGDVDAYIDHLEDKARSSRAGASAIARRLLRAGRTEDALAALNAAGGGPASEQVMLDWQLVRLDVLEALGRIDEAQADRWTWFEQTLQEGHLRAFLRHLPDFDDVEAEDRAFRIAYGFRDVHRALGFFIAWPAPAAASRLILERCSELDGEDYELLSRVVEALSARHPLAATIVLRAMINFTLDKARSSRYRHAARQLAECAALQRQLGESQEIPPHDAYLAHLRTRHSKKHGFWRHVSS